MKLAIFQSADGNFGIALEEVQAIYRSGGQVKVWLRHRELPINLDFSTIERAVESEQLIFKALTDLQ